MTEQEMIIDALCVTPSFDVAWKRASAWTFSVPICVHQASVPMCWGSAAE